MSFTSSEVLLNEYELSSVLCNHFPREGPRLIFDVFLLLLVCSKLAYFAYVLQYEGEC